MDHIGSNGRRILSTWLPIGWCRPNNTPKLGISTFKPFQPHLIQTHHLQLDGWIMLEDDINDLWKNRQEITIKSLTSWTPPLQDCYTPYNKVLVKILEKLINQSKKSKPRKKNARTIFFFFLRRENRTSEPYGPIWTVNAHLREDVEERVPIKESGGHQTKVAELNWTVNDALNGAEWRLMPLDEKAFD